MARITVLEVDGSEEMVSRALERVFGMFTGAATALVLPAAPPPEPVKRYEDQPAAQRPNGAGTRELSAPAPRAKPSRRGRKPRESKAEPAPEDHEGTPHAAALVLDVLRQRGPLRTPDIIDRLKPLHSSTVYLALKKLKTEGRVENRADAQDGYRKYFLKGA